jgi:hypothetical protein
MIYFVGCIIKENLENIYGFVKLGRAKQNIGLLKDTSNILQPQCAISVVNWLQQVLSGFRLQNMLSWKTFFCDNCSLRQCFLCLHLIILLWY